MNLQVTKTSIARNPDEKDYAASGSGMQRFGLIRPVNTGEASRELLFDFSVVLGSVVRGIVDSAGKEAPRGAVAVHGNESGPGKTQRGGGVKWPRLRAQSFIAGASPGYRPFRGSSVSAHPGIQQYREVFARRASGSPRA